MQHLSLLSKKIISRLNSHRQSTQLSRFSTLIFVFLVLILQAGTASPFGTLKIKPKWQFDSTTPLKVIAVDSKNTLYALSDEGELICLDSNGKSFASDSTDTSIKTLAIGKNDLLYVAFSDRICCLDSEKKMHWQQLLPSSPTSSMTISASNLLYYGSVSGISCLNLQKKGKTLWDFPLENGATDIVCDKLGHIYCRSAGSILCFNSEGKLLWDHPCEAQALAVSPQGEIYYYTPNAEDSLGCSTLYQINFAREMIWTHTTNSPITYLKTDQRGTLYFVTHDHCLSSFDSNKHHSYEITLHLPIDHFNVDKHGNFYISSESTLSCGSLNQFYDYGFLSETLSNLSEKLNSAKKDLNQRQLINAERDEITNSCLIKTHGLDVNLTTYLDRECLIPTSQPATEPLQSHTCFLAKDNLYCFDANQQLCWVINQVAGFSRKAFETFGHLYITSQSGSIYRLDPATKDILWEKKQQGGLFSLPTVDSEERLYSTLSSTGTIYCFNSDGEKIWDLKVDAAPSCSPLVDTQDNFYIVTQQNVIRCHSPSKELLWTWEMSSPLAFPMVVDDQCQLYFITDQNNVVSLDYAGKEKWTCNLPFSVTTSPTIDQKGRLYFTTDQGKLACWNEQKELWTVDSSSSVITPPAIAATGEILFGSRGGYIWSLSPEGKTLWIYSLKGKHIALPPAKDPQGSIHFVSEEGTVYSITLPSPQWHWPF
ncbi:MAG: PQQ-binding-like beta-propeller repeat protein [Chlamydiota bacterium]